jgi:chromosome partitioning protein
MPTLRHAGITVILESVKVITLAAQKGGCGKSALAISLAALACRNGTSVLILDADQQGTARQWQNGRDGRAPEVRAVRSAAELESTLGALPSDGFEVVLIDTPGRDEPGEAAAIRAGALTLIPCRPTMADVRAVPSTAAVARRLNKHFAFVLTQVPTRGTRADETAAALGEVGEVAPIRIGQRIAWQDSYAAGLGVSEYDPEGSAAQELGALWRWVNARLKRLK